MSFRPLAHAASRPDFGAVQGDGIAGIDSLDMAVMGRGLSHALGDQPMSMSIDDIGFSERG